MPAFRLFLISIAVLFSACSTITLTPEFSSNADLKAYHSFNFLAKQITQTQSLSTEKRIQSIIESQLAANGFEKRLSQEPDFYITFHTNVKGKVDVESYGYYYDNPNSQITTATAEPYYKNAALIIDVIDARNKELIWRGWEKANAKEAIARCSIEEATCKILNQFLQKSSEPDSSSGYTILSSL